MTARKEASLAAPRVMTASAAAADVLALIHAASFPAPWSADDFALFLRQPGLAAWMVGAGDDGGFILMRRVQDEAEIITIAVTPDARRRGMARALLTHALEEMRRR